MNSFDQNQYLNLHQDFDNVDLFGEKLEEISDDFGDNIQLN